MEDLDKAFVYWAELEQKLSLIPEKLSAAQSTALISENASRFANISSTIALLNQLSDLFDLLQDYERQLKALKRLAEFQSKALPQDLDNKYAYIVTQVLFYQFLIRFSSKVVKL